MRRFLVSAAAAAMLAFPSAAMAQVEQDGLVNVNIGDITIEDVNVAVAANIAAGICANLDLNAAILAVQEVDETGQEFSCQIGRSPQELTITQN